MINVYAAIVIGVFLILGIILHHWLGSGGSLKESLKIAYASCSWQSVIYAVVSIAYLLFTVLLLISTSVDRKAGLLFLMNSVVLIIGGLLLVVRQTTPVIIYCIATLFQIFILSIMLLMGWGTASIVVIINVSIIIGFCVLTGLTARSQRVSKE